MILEASRAWSGHDGESWNDDSPIKLLLDAYDEPHTPVIADCPLWRNRPGRQASSSSRILCSISSFIGKGDDSLAGGSQGSFAMIV